MFIVDNAEPPVVADGPAAPVTDPAMEAPRKLELLDDTQLPDQALLPPPKPEEPRSLVTSATATDARRR